MKIAKIRGRGKIVAIACATLAIGLGFFAAIYAQDSGSQDSQFTLKVNSDLVLVNVTVRDKNGNPVKGLKPDDFTLLEDGKPQHITSFDYENVDEAAPPQEPTRMGAAGVPVAPGTVGRIPESEARDHRLVVMFFDLTAMEPDQIDRAVAAAQKYVDKQMAPADLVAIVSLSSQIQIDQDFTIDHALLKQALARYTSAEGQGFDNGATGTTEGTADTGGAFAPDDTEYNQFNTDRKLLALMSLAQSMGELQQKKSIIYFSNGVQRTGIENQASLRAATNAAIHSNVSFYPVDTRGLEALPPMGDATTASLRGVSNYNGNAFKNQLDSNFQTQETLTTLAEDTGGKAFLDSNDLNGVFTRVQRDTASYYLLGFHSTNPARDGRYRKLTVRLKTPAVKLDYRQGYYAPRDFQHSTRQDREDNLQAELDSDLPDTDVPLYLSTGFFRIDEKRFYVPVSLVIPGSEIPFTQGGDKDHATIDILGAVRENLTRRQVGSSRETVKLALDQSQQVHRKNVQYTTGFDLPPGSYDLKFVVRENQTGRMGSFEAALTIPDYRKAPLKISSIMLASQRQEDRRKMKNNPLIRDGMELVPNVPHVFGSDQHLYFLYEIYDPSKQRKQEGESGNRVAAQPSGIRVLTSIQFFLGKVKVYETPLVESTNLNVPERKADAFEFDVPLAQLRPGYYTCQINIVDDTAGAFAFPRVPILVRETKSP